MEEFRLGSNGWSTEEFYANIGRDDKVAVIDFREGTECFKEYGPSITIVAVYKANEREAHEVRFQSRKAESTYGKVKVKFLTGAILTNEQKENLLNIGINTGDILKVLSGWSAQNLYHQAKKRSITVHEIPITKEPKGGDYDWMYGFKKRLVKEGTGLCPYEREWYLAMMMFYEEANLTEEERAEMYDQGALKPAIEMKYLEIKLEKEIASPEEDKRFDQLLLASARENYEILKREINSAGLSMERLYVEHPALLNHLLKGTTRYNPHRLNVRGKTAIYLDWRGYLHVFLRHAKEFEIGEQVKHKTKFLWHPKDIIMIIENVVHSVEKEIQEYWEKSPGKRFSKYGDQAFYFEGDYYTFHIDSDGRLSTFHRSDKKPGELNRFEFQ